MTHPARRPIVAGNWKMNTGVAEGVELAARLLALELPAGVEVVVLPPFTHLAPLHDLLAGSPLRLGAQDCFWEPAGAFTGEVSPRTLADLCQDVLVGHSERRHLLGETDEQTARKCAAALDAGLRVILAVGELLEERRTGSAESVVGRQLDAALEPLDAGQATRIVVAYEPVWAIGTGETASPDDAQAMCAFIRGRLGELWSGEVAASVPVLYGGSVTAENAASLFARPDVDGGLVGGASLRVEQFERIVAAAAGVSAGGAG